MGAAGLDCYTAAKGGIAAITRSMAVEFPSWKVRVNAIAPAGTTTDRVISLQPTAIFFLPSRECDLGTIRRRRIHGTRIREIDPMNSELTEQRIHALRQIIVALVRRDGPDLSARQMSVFLTSYLEDEPQTVRGLAANLKVSKSAITDALDRLAEFDLVRREIDPDDRRSILVQRTMAGAGYLRDLKKILAEARKVADTMPSNAGRNAPPWATGAIRATF
jgi:DNA-binding MarR family transcriptional regulator